MKKTLMLVFNLDTGKTADLSISAPREDVKMADIQQAADKIIETKLFTLDGATIVGLKKAYLRTVDEQLIGE